MTTSPVASSGIPDLHDATLESIHVRWPSGQFELIVRVGSPRPALLAIAGTSLAYVEVPRRAPWGMSQSINGARVSRTSDLTRLEIEMQSGDTLVIEAASISVQDSPKDMPDRN